MGQLTALFYKNWILYKRSLLGNVLEFAIPIFFIMFVILVRKLDTPTTYSEQSFNNPANQDYYYDVKGDSITTHLKKCTPGSIVAIAPAGNTLATNIRAELVSLSIPSITITNYNSESEIESYIRGENYNLGSKICFAIVVQKSDAATHDYQYKLRFNISVNRGDGPLTSLKLTLDQAINLDLFKTTYKGGMIGANLLVNNEILQIESGSTTNYMENIINPVYQENYILDNIYTNLGGSIGIIALLPLLLIYLRQTSSMLSEKEGKVRESMLIMGMKIRNYYFTWFVRYFVVYLFLHLICSAIMANQLKNVPFLVPFVVFILFDIVLIIQNFFIQVFLTRAKIGIVIALLFFVLQYIISFVAVNSDNPTLSVNAAISIIPHAAFVLAFQTMIYAESYQISPGFSQSLNNYVIGYAVLSFALNIVFYLLLTWYLDQVIPNEFGAKRHPLFCCFNKSTPYTVEQKEEKKRVEMANPKYRDRIQEVDESLRGLERENKMIEIVGLRKQFNEGETVAVEDLTINMYNNQIFSLLGHNGAGKTTTISMLTGMIEPSDGYISVFGETDLDKIRAMIGVCPQHDTLYEDLTVEEHIELFSTFKGLEGEELRSEVQKLIGDVNLSEKRGEYAKNLSGGQKRRLSVAIAFAGRSKVIILDEPTSGMDTSARRYIWELLKTYKNDRAIILTTHFMDEADYLGDRIGIMGGGKMVCCGSSMFLKNKFGVGYNITFVKQGNEVDSARIIALVRKHVPHAEVLSNIATDLSLQLPLQSLPQFSALFREIDDSKAQLKYAEYGISITTLEEVFLKVGEELENNKEQEMKGKSNGEDSGDLTSPAKVSPQEEGQYIIRDINYDEIPRYDNACVQFFIHFKATFLKRLRVIRRDLKSFIFELLLPIVIIILALQLMRVSFITDQSAQSINLNTYLSEQNPVVLPMASDVAGRTASISSFYATKYGSKISVRATTSAASSTFDYDQLFPLKQQLRTLKGGIYFSDATVPSGANTLYKYQTFVSTRSPTSAFFLPTLGAEAIINRLTSNPVTITVTNHPLPRTYAQLQINNTISGFFGGFIFSLALAFKFASIIAFIVKEREDRSKHQQIVSGMKLSAYWLANFVYDFTLYLVVAVVAVGLCSALNITSFTTGTAYPALWMLFILYGLSYISFTYIFSFLFKDYGNAQAGFYFLTFIIGGMIPILTFLLRILGTDSNPVGRGLAWLLRIYPSFSFGEGLLNIGSVSLYGIIENNSKSLDPLDLEVGLAPIIYLGFQSVLYFVLLFVIESLLKNEAFMRCFSSETKVTESQPIVEEDVLEQYKRANAADPEDYEILTKELRKVYSVDSDKKYKIAVDNISFAVKKGEVFGLLGVNGAGKTTTFKMLAGEVTSTAGDSYFNGLKISDNLDKVREGLGYCPQFDALIENLTVKEQLEMFYDMKSLDARFKEQAIARKIEEMNLGEYTDKLSGTLSGGNKRKLSVAMAMIGNPRIIFLDEPSTGMDPKARRFMWKVISRVATEKKNATVILTTHSMEEAEALSTRLGIMVKGNFKCIGTPQHIKSKYGEGFEIEVKLNALPKSRIEAAMQALNLGSRRIIKENEFEAVLEFLKVGAEDRLEISEGGSGNYIYNSLKAGKKEVETFTLVEFLEICRLEREVLESIAKEFGSTEVLERLQTFMRLKIKDRVRVGRLFDFFEKSKDRLAVQQYTIKQATVEQIFNKFAGEGELSEYNP